MMAYYKTSAPMTFYGGDYRPDDEPPPDAVLEEKRILEHQFRRPSPSRRTPSTTSSVRPPVANRQATNRSLRARTSGSSPRRSLQRSSMFGNRRSTTILDRGRTASMPAVPIVRHELNSHKTTIISTLMKTLKIIILVIQTFKSTEILNVLNDLIFIEKQLNIKGMRRRRKADSLSLTVSRIVIVNAVAQRTNSAFKEQLSLAVALHFAGVLVDVYLLCFHGLGRQTIDATPLGGFRAINHLWRLSVISSVARYAVKQAFDVFYKLGQIQTSLLDIEDIEEPSFGNVPRPDGPVLEEYRLRSFSITASGVCNLGDFVRYASPPPSKRHHQPVGKRESCPASVSSTPSHQQNANNSAGGPATAAAAAAAVAGTAAATSHTVCTEFSRFRKPSTALINKFKANDTVESYKVALLGAPGVGKTTISVQFSTSDYICVYDTSIDEDCACRTIRVMINGQEAELMIIDIPYVEMSIETLCSTYNPNVFIVMYSVVDERSFDIAEQMLLFLWKGEYIHTRGVILVGNKSDLERTRKIQTNVGRNLAYSWNCKFIETSSGIDHNVDKLLVGILAQIKLNPLRERMYNSKRKKYSVTKLYKDFLAYLRGVKSSENLFSI